MYILVRLCTFTRYTHNNKQYMLYCFKTLHSCIILCVSILWQFVFFFYSILCIWGVSMLISKDLVHSFLPGVVFHCMNAAAKSLQSCQTLYDPIDGSPPDSPVPGILQARTLEWVAISFSNAWKWKVNWSRSVVSNPQRPHGLQPSRLLHPWDFPGKSTGVGCHCLLRHCMNKP